MARLKSQSLILPRYLADHSLGTLGTSVTDATATYSVGGYGILYEKTSHNNGISFQAWGYGRTTNYEGIIGGDAGGAGPYRASMCTNGGTLGIQTASAATATHFIIYHGLAGTVTADAAYAFNN